MSIRQDYNQWAGQYDTNQNRTRDLEASALRELLNGLHFQRTLEIGCGTGKNTQSLLKVSDKVTAVDFSEEMLVIARRKVLAPNVKFVQADINKKWEFAEGAYDLITFSLVLEHIENLKPVFEKAGNLLKTDGIVYVGELHPFKQYNGTKARFGAEDGTKVLTCFNHHISDFTGSAAAAGLKIERVEEFFDDNDRSGIARILSLVFRKQ
jgi:ubiquinone/menaquinone biosynthesis C-methylase UbiE